MTADEERAVLHLLEATPWHDEQAVDDAIDIVLSEPPEKPPEAQP